MQAGEPTDVTSTLTDLERKLVDLERELSTVAGGTAGAVASTTPIVPATPAETRDTTLRVEDLRGEIADLVKFRDQLEAAASQLVSEYDRLVARLQAAEPVEDHAIGPPMEAAPAEAAPAEPAPSGWTPGPLPPAVAAGLGGPGSRPPAAAAPGASDAVSFVGAVVVDAGPFTDITTLQSFEQGLSRVDGAEDVYVKSFEGNRAHIDVRLSNPVPLVQLLREQLSLPIIAREAGEGRLVVDLAAPDSHGT